MRLTDAHAVVTGATWNMDSNSLSASLTKAMFVSQSPGERRTS
jgi:hypothetical protein